MTIHDARTLTPPKYVVLKYDDYVALANLYEIDSAHEEIVGDAVVIRLQDRHAAAGLAAYTMSLHTAIEVLEDAGVPVPPTLIDSRDYFVEQANAALSLGRKDPD